ncbi:uncharacterized protein SCHCODRAFT_02277349 [Schizophyllum commune H4-8]|uniref:uncharacterized protein n=1 Tax=Schizophyllum commune (strain H4-8 / FGSC 9210) TaxID=578458 RepID=UPI00215E71B5|nr:uncharacterized protein SCHCODRAFT_02277349 [Schizophyllum commune H4-8]KAI5891883.1 hypothetical protein SCHCODRAFT_02277349 [Schizophyllum commune H4-8]
MALMAVKFLRFSTVDKLSHELWPFDDTVWTHLLHWVDYIIPADDVPRAVLLLPSADARHRVLAFLGVFESVLTLPKEAAQTYFLSGANSALNTLVALWAHWPELVSSQKMEPEAALWCPRVFRALWDIFDSQVAEDVIVPQILRVSGGSARGVFRTCAAILRALSSAGDVAHRGAELGHQATFIGTILNHYDAGPQAVPSSFVATAVRVLGHQIAVAPEDHDVWALVLGMLFVLCYRSDHAMMLAMRQGIFHLLVRIRVLCTHCCSGPPPRPLDQTCSGGITGALMTFMRGSLWSRRAVVDFRDAYDKYATRMLGITLREDEELVRTTAESRYKLLLDAEEEWPSIAKCCNTKCVSTDVVSLRSCPCGENLYCSKLCQRAHWKSELHRSDCERNLEGSRSTYLKAQLRPLLTVAKDSTSHILRAKDVHFLVVIARAYVEANYQRIMTRLARLGAGDTTSVTVDVPLFCNPMRPKDFEIVAYTTSCASDLCPYPSVVAQVIYEQSDGMHDRFVSLIPRGAPWRYRKDVFLPITATFYDPPTDWTDLD